MINSKELKIELKNNLLTNCNEFLYDFINSYENNIENILDKGLEYFSKFINRENIDEYDLCIRLTNDSELIENYFKKYVCINRTNEIVFNQDCIPIELNSEYGESIINSPGIDIQSLMNSNNFNVSIKPVFKVTNFAFLNYIEVNNKKLIILNFITSNLFDDEENDKICKNFSGSIRSEILKKEILIEIKL